jgi:hypothetical protein
VRRRIHTWFEKKTFGRRNGDNSFGTMQFVTSEGHLAIAAAMRIVSA